MQAVVRNEDIIHYTSSIIHLLLHQTSYIKHHTSDYVIHHPSNITHLPSSTSLHNLFRRKIVFFEILLVTLHPNMRSLRPTMINPSHKATENQSDMMRMKQNNDSLGRDTILCGDPRFLSLMKGTQIKMNIIKVIMPY